jgi:hypothetical protein
MIIIRYFSELVSISKSFRPIVSIRNQTHWKVVYIYLTHEGKLGLEIFQSDNKVIEARENVERWIEEEELEEEEW